MPINAIMRHLTKDAGNNRTMRVLGAMADWRVRTVLLAGIIGSGCMATRMPAAHETQKPAAVAPKHRKANVWDGIAGMFAGALAGTFLVSKREVQ